MKNLLRRLVPEAFYRRLWLKIAAMLVIIMTIPVMLLGFLLIDTSQEAVRKSVLINHREIATRAAEEIELFILRAYDTLGATAAMLGVLSPAPFKQETILVELILNQPLFIRASSVDLSGRELASSELGRGLTWQYPQEALNRIRQRRNYISPVKFMDNATPFVTIAIPIKRLGKINGMLIADANLRGIWDMVDRIQISDTSRSFLVDATGTLIAHQDKKRVLKKETMAALPDVREVLRGTRGAQEITDAGGRHWISAYAPVSHLGWGMVLRETQTTAYIFSRRMRLQAWLIILLSEIFALIVSILIARLVTRPLKSLIAQMKGVAEGNLDHTLKITRRDELGELLETFNHMTERLKVAKMRERFSAIGEAASRIAHELKNSLVAIKAFIQMLPGRHHDPEFIRKFNTIIPPEIDRWERMVKEITEFSRRDILKKTECHIGEILEEVIQMVEEEAVRNKISLQCRRERDIPVILADPERLKQVFLNIIMNALQATEGGGTLDISARYNIPGEEPEEIILTFRDSGAGIAPEELEKIFEPFYTSRAKGMGLGLTICKKIIEQHQGTISVKSEALQGTSFTITLPAHHP